MSPGYKVSPCPSEYTLCEGYPLVGKGLGIMGENENSISCFVHLVMSVASDFKPLMNAYFIFIITKKSLPGHVTVFHKNTTTRAIRIDLWTHLGVLFHSDSASK